jgi:hypothetical protein
MNNEGQGMMDSDTMWDLINDVVIDFNSANTFPKARSIFNHAAFYLFNNGILQNPLPNHGKCTRQITSSDKELCN